MPSPRRPHAIEVEFLRAASRKPRLTRAYACHYPRAPCELVRVMFAVGSVRSAALWSETVADGGVSRTRSAACGRSIRSCPSSGRAKRCGWRCRRRTGCGSRRWCGGGIARPRRWRERHGVVLAHLIDGATAARPAPGPLDWMDWERQKALRLLYRGRLRRPGRAVGRSVSSGRFSLFCTYGEASLGNDHDVTWAT